MSVYQKLSDARDEFHKLQLKKTGHNKFANYYYFELGDFLIPALSVFKKHGLCGIISFGSDMATLSIVDIESGSKVDITSPMSTAALKGCHEVQNLGAVQTYIRRYLWVAALEIVEHDALDSTTGKDEKRTSVKKDDVQPKTLSDDRFYAAVKSIKEGTYTTDKLRAAFVLTEQQEAKLIEALSSDNA